MQPYCSLLMDEPTAMHDVVAEYRARGFAPSRSAGVRLGGATILQLDEAIVRAAREAAGDGNRLFVDAGASDAHWPHGLKWAMRTADMLKDYELAGSRNRCGPMQSTISAICAAPAGCRSRAARC